MRNLLLLPFITALLCFGSSPTCAQTYFYIGSISVMPAEPTTTDDITISLEGQLSSTGAHIVSTSYMLIGNIVHVTVNAVDQGGLDVLVPHTEEVSIGMLPAGSYGILIDGDFAMDSAPEFQHGFNVTVAGQANCEDLTIASIQWATFSDTAVTLHVLNTQVGFDLPAFVLLNAAGDTIARETPNFFAIANDSWHTLRIHPNADVPVGEFAATVHLWTGFFTELACTWEMTVDLCPATECRAVFPYLSNFGDAMVDGSFAWSINDEAGTVASGTFVLQGEQQSDQAEACLAPGNYSLVVSALQEPAGGQLFIGVGGEGWSDGVQQPFPQVIPSAPLVFDVVPGCSEMTNDIVPPTATTSLLDVRSTAGAVDLRSLDGAPLGIVEVRDALGRLVQAEYTIGDRAHLQLGALGVYVVRARDQALKVLVGDQ